LRQTPAAAKGAAAGLSGLSDAARAAADAQMAATKQTLAVEEAFAKLGLTSSATLKKQADEARAAYKTIKDSGLATAIDLQRAFEIYAEKAIAANGGIATDAIRVEAAMAGVKLKTDEVTESAESAARAYKKIAKGATEAKDAVEGLAKAAEATREERVGGSISVPQEWIDANGGRFPRTKAEMEKAKEMADANKRTRDFSSSSDTPSASVGPSIQQNTFRIQIALPGRRDSVVNVAARSDADQLIDIFKLLESEMNRAN